MPETANLISNEDVDPVEKNKETIPDLMNNEDPRSAVLSPYRLFRTNGKNVKQEWRIQKIASAETIVLFKKTERGILEKTMKLETFEKWNGFSGTQPDYGDIPGYELLLRDRTGKRIKNLLTSWPPPGTILIQRHTGYSYLSQRLGTSLSGDADFPLHFLRRTDMLSELSGEMPLHTHNFRLATDQETEIVRRKMTDTYTMQLQELRIGKCAVIGARRFVRVNQESFWEQNKEFGQEHAIHIKIRIPDMQKIIAEALKNSLATRIEFDPPLRTAHRLPASELKKILINDLLYRKEGKLYIDLQEGEQIIVRSDTYEFHMQNSTLKKVEVFNSTASPEIYHLAQIGDFTRFWEKIVEPNLFDTHIVKNPVRRDYAQKISALPAQGMIIAGETIFLKVGPDTFSRQETGILGKTVCHKSVGNKEVLDRLCEKHAENPDLIKFEEKPLPASFDSVNMMSRVVSAQINAFEIFKHELYSKPYETSSIVQGKIGDCYLLAGLNSFKKTSARIFEQVLQRSVKKEGLQDWLVHLCGFDYKDLERKISGRLGAGAYKKAFPDGWLRISTELLRKWQETYQLAAETGDIILELAYAILLEGKATGKTIHAIDDFSHKRENRIHIEGGFGHRALADFLPEDICEKHKIADYESTAGEHSLRDNGNGEIAADFLINEFRKSRGKHVVTINTPRNDGNRWVIANAYEVDQNHNKKPIKRYLPPKHANSLLDITADDSGYMLHIEDIHDTNKPFWMTLDHFLDRYSQISYVTLRRKNT